MGLEGALLAREGGALLGAAGAPAPADRASALAIIASVALAGNGALVCAVAGWGALPGAGWRLAGLALLAAGQALRIWAVRTLGRFFTAVVRTEPDQAVVRRGPYRILRHPSYTGTFLTLLGWGLALGTGWGAALLVILPLPAYLYRIHVEEHALLAALGPPYAAYMRQTRRLIPGVW